MKKAFFVSIPHSGERVPDEVTWLQDLPEPIQMCDVDRFVDLLYRPAIENLCLVHIVTEWHRYVVDLNRIATDIDRDSVLGSENPPGSFTTGLHWSKTTRGNTLMPEPISQELHQHLLKNYFEPFHQKVRDTYEKFKAEGHEKVYQLDAHSMPSMGTKAHRDPGEKRAEIVISDLDGKSCEPRYMDLVTEAYKGQGFQVAHNWPYKGGRVTQSYGHPEKGQHAIQVEMNRELYMDEETKQLHRDKMLEIQPRLTAALEHILGEL